MAHGFKNKGRDTTFVSKKELAWHRLGKVVDSMTSAECMKQAGLDFTVKLAPMVALTGEPLTRDAYRLKAETLDERKVLTSLDDQGNRNYFTTSDVPNSYATYRTDTNVVLGTVGNRYEIIQNIEAFDFFDEIIGQGHAQYETAGALGDGQTIFITAKLPSKLLVNKEDIDKYLLFTMSHDGTSAIKVMFTPIRVVCNNTLSAALQGNGKVVIKHTANARGRLEVAHKVLGIDKVSSEKYEEIFNRFQAVKITDKELEEFIDNVFDFEYENLKDLSTRSKNKRLDLLDYYETGVGQEGIQGTVWGAYNMVTGYLQNSKESKAEAQFKNDYFSTNLNIRTKAFNTLLEKV